MAMATKGPRKTFKSLDETLGFGMNRDRTIRDVLESDISYLRWMHDKQTIN